MGFFNDIFDGVSDAVSGIGDILGGDLFKGAGAAAISSIGSMLGQSNTNNTNSANTAAVNDANLQIARDNNAFQERMSNTAYQRASNDMTAAGINPMLAVMRGGASQPNGSMATMQTPQYQSALSAGVSGAQAGQRLHNETSRTQADITHLGMQNRLLEENITHEKLKQEFTKITSKYESAKEESESQRKYLLAAQTANETNLYNRDDRINREIDSRIASNYGSASHSYSASGLARAHTQGAYNENVMSGDQADFVRRYPGLNPRLDSIGKGTHSAKDLMTGVGSLLPWRNTWQSTNGNTGVTTFGKSHMGRW